MATSLGTLTLDLVAKIGGFTDGLTAAERQAQKSADEINKQIASIGVTSYAVGNALGQYLKQGVDLAIDAFPDLIESVAKFQDIADKTGGSASGFAAFAVSAKTADTSIETIVNSSTRLSKALLQAGDDTKPVTAGLNALGINIASFKQLQPDQQIAAVATAFGGFADGANKAAVAQQLFGKSGADLLVFFKDYTDQGGGVSILTDQMIKQADDYSDASKRAGAELQAYAGVIAVQLLPAMTAIKETAVELIKQFLGLDDSATKLGNNTSVSSWADTAIKDLGTVADAAQIVGRSFDIVGTAIGALLATHNAVFSGDFKGALNIQLEAGKDLLNKTLGIGDNLVSTTLDKAYAKAKANAALPIAADTRPQLPATAPQKKGAADQAAQLAKAQLAADLDGIKQIGKAQQDAIANDQKVLDAMHSAGLTDDTDYFAQRKTLIDENTKAQVDSLNAQIARMQAQTFTGNSAAKDQVDNNKKISDAQAQVTKIQVDAVTQSKVLDIQEQARLGKQAAMILASKQAAQDYFDTVNKGYAQNLAAVGKGDKTNDFNSQVAGINDNFDRQRQQLQNQKAQTELATGAPLNADAQKQFDAQLAIINDFQAKSLASFKQNYADIAAAQADWSNGAIKSLQNYADQAADTAGLTKGVFDDAFKGLEDNLTSFLTTGKANWKDFADSIVSDLIRIAVKQEILGPLAQALGGSQATGGSGLLGSLLGLAGAGGTQTAALAVGNAAGASGGDALGAFIGASKFSGGGYTGSGAANDPAGIVHKGEVVWSQSDIARAGGVGAVQAMRAGGGSGGGQTVNFYVPGKIDRSTQTQLAQKTRAATNSAQSRFG